MHKLLCLVIIFLSHLPIQSRIEAEGAGFSVELIRRDSPKSPFYDPLVTQSEFLRKAVQRSKTRIQYFKSFQATMTVQSTVFPSEGEFLMNLYIGTPPVAFYAIADTGSDLIWVQCTSCQRCFNSSGSSTYTQLSCSSEFCLALNGSGSSSYCNNAQTCTYFYAYAGGSTTTGILSNDTISLDSTTGQIVGFPSSVFGCSYISQGNFFGGSGLFGLGGGPLSLISQLGAQIDYKFSYCFVPYLSNSTSKLRFGSDAVLNGSGVASTPLLSDPNKPTFYYLTLGSISIGNSSTQTPQTQGNIIIDSGTTLTMLNPTFYAELEAIVQQAIGVQPVQDPSNTFSLCYGASSVSNFPDMTFHFNGADLVLPPSNTFVPYDAYNLTCLAILPSDSLSIFGNVAQADFQVEYDLQGKLVNFAAADCTLF